MCANSPKSHPPLSSGPTRPSIVHLLIMKPLPTSCPPHVRRWEPQATLLLLQTLKAPVAPARVAFLGWEPCLVTHWAFCPS